MDARKAMSLPHLLLQNRRYRLHSENIFLEQLIIKLTRAVLNIDGDNGVTITNIAFIKFFRLQCLYHFICRWRWCMFTDKGR